MRNLLKIFLMPCIPFLMLFSAIVFAEKVPALYSPGLGILCDSYFCANARGISEEDTRKYLGEKTSQHLFSQSGVNLSEFTYANGIFCDVKEKVCRENRYFGADGKRSGGVVEKYTKLLFGS